MSSNHRDRLSRIDSRNEHALRRVGVLDKYFDAIRDETHRMVQAEPALAFAAPDVLFARMTAAETAPDYGSCLRRAAYGFLLLRAQDRAEQASPFTGGEAA